MANEKTDKLTEARAAFERADEDRDSADRCYAEGTITREAFGRALAIRDAALDALIAAAREEGMREQAEEDAMRAWAIADSYAGSALNRALCDVARDIAHQIEAAAAIEALSADALRAQGRRGALHEIALHLDEWEQVAGGVTGGIPNPSRASGFRDGAALCRALASSDPSTLRGIDALTYRQGIALAAKPSGGA